MQDYARVVARAGMFPADSQTLAHRVAVDERRAKVPVSGIAVAIAPLPLERATGRRGCGWLVHFQNPFSEAGNTRVGGHTSFLPQ